MTTAKPRTVPDQTEYEKNREKFTAQQLSQYNGQWVAFSGDGARIIAAAAELLELDQKVETAGENPQDVWLEFIINGTLSWRSGISGMMEFRYRAQRLAGPPPPSLSAQATYRLRPLVAVIHLGRPVAGNHFCKPCSTQERTILCFHPQPDGDWSTLFGAVATSNSLARHRLSAALCKR